MKKNKISLFLENVKKNEYLVEYFDDFKEDLEKKFELFYKSVVIAIMAVPKRKQTPQELVWEEQNMKFSPKNVIEDKKSGEYRLSHHLDLKTGMYKGRQVLDPKE